jgi:hypothetical protein
MNETAAAIAAAAALSEADVSAGARTVPNPASSACTRPEPARTRSCAYCGESFDRTRPHQRFCRTACRCAYFRTRGVARASRDRDELGRTPFE